MSKLLKRLVKEESGQAMVEYGLIIALVAVVAIVGLTMFGNKIRDFFKTLGGDESPLNPTPPAPPAG
ncbi:MAG TPA: Flp family type IVb pilin [Firmicutes bacterium]|nr:Flp family type IVb pilin [Bacillota bacterium]